MLSTEGLEQEYSFDRGKLLKLAAVTSLAAALCLFAAFFDEAASGWRHLYLGVVGIVSAAIAVAIGLRSLSRRPGLVISGLGLRVPAIGDETIAWTSVLDIKRLTLRKSDTLTLKLDPAVARALTRRGLARMSPRNASVSVPLNHLIGDPDAITAQCEAFWRAGHAASSTALPIAAAPPGVAFRLNQPWLTYVLLVLLAVVFACELAFAVNTNNGDSPSVLTLAYMGGIIGSRIWQNGEWWRLFTAPLLHGGVTHILFNSLVLWSAGTALERLVGWRWLGALFAFSALGGAVASLLINAPNIVGVGASGGIMGLLGALFVMSFRLPSGGSRTQLQMRAAQTIIPALLPILSSGKGVAIDYAAHGGGVAAGAALAFALFKLWPRDRAHPPFGLVAAGFAIAFFAIAAGSLVPILHLRAALH